MRSTTDCITDGAIVAACTLAHRYISDRKMPDKAIGLMDEAASALKMQMESVPSGLTTSNDKSANWRSPSTPSCEKKTPTAKRI